MNNTQFKLSFFYSQCLTFVFIVNRYVANVRDMQLLCFQHLSDSRFFFFCFFFVVFFFFFFFFLLGALHRRSKFENFCHYLMQNLRTKIILVVGFKQKIKYFYFFSPKVKITEKCAKIDREGSLDAGFQQLPFVQNVWTFHNIIMEKSII